jgi:hypothetical protein
MTVAALKASPGPSVAEAKLDAWIEREFALEAGRVAKACRLLLADLRRFEAWPEPMAAPDVDRKYIPLSLKGLPHEL